MAQSVDRPSSAISRTAVYVAAGRAIGAREPDPSARNPDYLAERLLGDPSLLALKHPIVGALSLDYDEAMKDVQVAGNVRAMTVRTRFIDEGLHRAVADGASQVVILGAGYDSHAYRCQDRLRPARVFEVDRPMMQALKKRRVREALGRPPANLTYVPIDFEHESLAEVLTRHGYDPSGRTFFILEGVTMYLPEEAVCDTLRFVAAHPPGSGIVFDFVSRTMVDMINQIDLTRVPSAAKAFVEQFLDLIRDEPWVFGLPAGEEREFLDASGLDLREVLQVGGEESARRYLTRADGTQVGAAAMAAVAERMGPGNRAGAQPGMAYQLAEAAAPGH